MSDDFAAGVEAFDRAAAGLDVDESVTLSIAREAVEQADATIGAQLRVVAWEHGRREREAKQRADRERQAKAEREASEAAKAARRDRMRSALGGTTK